MMLWRQPKRTAHPLQWVFISSNYALSHSCSARLISPTPLPPTRQASWDSASYRKKFPVFSNFFLLDCQREGVCGVVVVLLLLLLLVLIRAKQKAPNNIEPPSVWARMLFLASQSLASWCHVNTPHMCKPKTSCHRNQLDKPLSHHGSSGVSVQLSRQPACLHTSDRV